MAESVREENVDLTSRQKLEKPPREEVKIRR
jgi:hypothetical protein